MIKKESKKILVSLFISVLMISLLSGFVSAQDEESLTGLINSFVKGTVSVLEPILSVLVGPSKAVDGVATQQEIFLAKVIIVILLMSIIYAALSQVEFFVNNEWSLWVVSLAVPLLGVRFLADKWIVGAALPSNTFFIAVTGLLPFVLFGLMVLRLPSPTARRLCWLFFAVVFVFLYISRVKALGNAANIYAITAFLAIVMVFIDGSIQRWWGRIRAEKQLSNVNYRKYLGLLRMREALQEDYLTAVRNNVGAVKVKYLQTRIDQLDNQIARLVP